MVRTLPWLFIFAGLPAAASAQDMMFKSDWGPLASFNDKPMWAGAARCAAFEDTVEEAIAIRRDTLAQSRREYPAHADRYRDDPEWEQRMRDDAAHDRQYWRRWGLTRLKRDRPGQNVEALFDAQVDQELTDFRRASSGLDRRALGSRREAYRNTDEACIAFLLEAGGSINRMERGVTDRHFRAEASAAEGRR